MSQSGYQSIRSHLLSGKTITVLEAISLYQVYRLAPVIHRLRNEEGLDIVTAIKKDMKGRDYAEYVMARSEKNPKSSSKKTTRKFKGGLWSK